VKRLVAVLLALVLVASACGDDDTTQDATTTTTADPGTDDPPADDGDDTEGADGTDTDDPPVEDVPLFSSYQGVSETEIDFGVAAIDAEALVPFGIDLGTAPVEEMYVAWTQAQNDRGGVLGRDLVPHTRLFLPIGTAPSDEICAEFAEDIEVFAVTGQFLADNPLCVTELYGLPYIGHFGLNDERDEKSEGRFIATEMANSAQRYGGVAEMIAQGDLDGKKVALWWENPVDVAFADLVRPLLEASDVEIVTEVEVGDFGQDQIASDNAEDQRMERVISSGADFILSLGNITPPTEAAERANFSGTIGFTNGQVADQIIFPEAELSENSTLPERTFGISTNKPTPEEALADEGIQQCIDEYNSLYDEPIDLESKTTVQALVNHCRAFRLMVLIFETAGVDLNPDSFVEAAESLGTFSLPAMPVATLGPDNHAAGSQIRRYEYDASVGYHLPVGDPIDPVVPG